MAGVGPGEEARAYANNRLTARRDFPKVPFVRALRPLGFCSLRMQRGSVCARRNREIPLLCRDAPP